MSSSAAAPSLPAVHDFPDRLPAMVVKELRQGLRARYFAEAIAGFHLMLILAILPMMSLAEPREAEGIQRFIWWVFAAVLVLLLPLRGLSALTAERRANTLDTLLLTNIRAGRIVWGKWLAIAAQVALIALSMVPYVLMLYSGGGISLPGSFVTLLRLLIAGFVLAAALVSLSWHDSWLYRAAPGLALALLVMNEYAWPAIGTVLGNGRVFMDAGPGRVLAELLGGAAVTVILLENTARRLAPIGEFHQSLPRVMAAAAVLGTWIISHPAANAVMLPVLTLVSLSALVERWPVRQPETGTWHQFPGLAPGWPHGVLWLGVLWALAVWMLLAQTSPLAAQALRLAAWLFWSRLLLFLMPADWAQRSGTLILLAVAFQGLQAAFKLGAELLNAPIAHPLANMVPAPFALIPNTGTTDHFLISSGISAAACAIIALIALAKHQHARKQETTLP